METEFAVFASDLGWMCAAMRGSVLYEVTFGHPSPDEAIRSMRVDGAIGARPSPPLKKLIQRLQKFCRKPVDDFLDVELNLGRMTDFQRAVVTACRQIRPGRTWSYGELASRAGRPKAVRAVGQVMATNRFPLIVPCHRVIASNGSLGGYSARDGLNMKRRLLEIEGVLADACETIAASSERHGVSHWPYQQIPDKR